MQMVLPTGSLGSPWGGKKVGPRDSETGHGPLVGEGQRLRRRYSASWCPLLAGSLAGFAARTHPPKDGRQRWPRSKSQLRME